jgi:excisionase family DNA binding protein
MWVGSIPTSPGSPERRAMFKTRGMDMARIPNMQDENHDTEKPVIVNQIIAPDYYFKEILTIKDASEYLGLPMGSIHQYLFNNKIPCYKPTGKNRHIYFKKSELDIFVLQNKKCADYEVSSNAEAILNGEAQ